MRKKKYNNGSWVDISKINSKEIKKAIKEWSGGNKYLEKLLLDCYNNEIITKGSQYEVRPYLELSLNKSRDKTKRMINEVESMNGLQILILPDGGNPLTSSDFYKPIFNLGFINDISKKYCNEFFKRMDNAIASNDNIENNYIDSLFELYDYFSEKESNLNFRVIFINNKYSFKVEVTNALNNRKKIRNILENIGLEYKEEEPYFIDFYQKTGELNNFTKDIKQIKSDLINNWTIKREEKVNDNMTFTQTARILRRKFTNAEEGKKKFNDWLKSQ